MAAAYLINVFDQAFSDFDCSCRCPEGSTRRCNEQGEDCKYTIRKATFNIGGVAFLYPPIDRCGPSATQAADLDGAVGKEEGGILDPFPWQLTAIMVMGIAVSSISCSISIVLRSRTLGGLCLSSQVEKAPPQRSSTFSKEGCNADAST